MGKKKILLVEEEKPLLDTLADLLEADYDCISAGNDEEGLSYLKEHVGEIDLIITDLHEPEPNGGRMLKQIESNPMYRNIPVLVLVSMDRPEDITYAFDLGADDVLSRPVNPTIVKKRVNNMLRVGGNRMVHNVMEDLVRAEIDENLDSLGICTCPVCQRDLLTLTLNNVTPRYVTSEKGEAITKAVQMASREEKIKLLTEVTYYAQMVRQRPHHNSRNSE